MKKFLAIAFAALSLLSLASCQKEEEAAVADSISATSSNLFYVSDGGALTATFTTNAAWTAKSDAEWLTVDPASGEAGEVTVKITAAENTSLESRTASVTVNAGSAKISYSATQTAAEAEEEKHVFAAGIQHTISCDAQQIVLVVNTDEEFTVSIPEGDDFVEVMSTKALPSISKVVLSINANYGLVNRSAVITVDSPSSSQVFYLVQESAYVQTTLLGASYLGMACKLYDAENSCYLEDYDEYALMLYGQDGALAILALNVAKDDNIDEFPVGEFVLDVNGSHASGTFSVAEDEPVFTTFGALLSDEYTKVVDGTILVSKEEDGTYSVSTMLLDENEEYRLYSYVGAIDEVDDNSLAAIGQSIECYEDYGTHFATKAIGFSYTFTISRAIDENTPEINYVTVEFYTDPSTDPTSFPYGKYTLAAGNELPVDSTAAARYASGYYAAQPGTFTISANDKADYETRTYYDFAEGTTIEFTEEDDLLMIIFDGKLSTGEDFKATIPAYNNCELSVSHGMIAEDTDYEFNVTSGQYIAYWYGDAFGLGGNVFYYGFSNIDWTYTFSATLHSSAAYTYEKNAVNNKFCGTPIPDAVFNFVDSLPAANGDYICNIKSPVSRKAKITNGYTGSTVYINSGSITLSGADMKLDIEGKLFYMDGTDSGQTIKYTGVLPNNMYYARDSHTSAISWAE